MDSNGATCFIKGGSWQEIWRMTEMGRMLTGLRGSGLLGIMTNDEGYFVWRFISILFS